MAIKTGDIVKATEACIKFISPGHNKAWIEAEKARRLRVTAIQDFIAFTEDIATGERLKYHRDFLEEVSSNG